MRSEDQRRRNRCLTVSPQEGGADRRLGATRRRVAGLSGLQKVLLSTFGALLLCSFGCVMPRSGSGALVLKESPAEDEETVLVSPILLARQESAEHLFFGFGEEPEEDATLYQDFPLTPVGDEEEQPTSSADHLRRIFAAAELLWPVNGRITSPFGMRRGRLHAGVDIGAPRGTPIRASLSGQVLLSTRKRAYGKVVVLGHGHDHQTLYAHLLSTKVKSGSFVNQGDIIGYVGRTGRATGYHLHFETRVAGGVPQDPLRFLPDLGNGNRPRSHASLD